MFTFARTARSTWLSALVLLVAVTFGLPGCADQESITPPSYQETSAPSLSDPPGHAGGVLSERRVTELPDGRVLEELRGEPAHRHLEQLVSRRPEAFANLSLLAKGYHPTEEVLVQRIRRSRHAANRGNGIFLAQSYEESDSEGEIIFWSWDNGDPGTWEGVIWFEDYTSGLAGTNEAQADISSTEEHVLVFLDNTWESSGGGGGGGDGSELIEPVMWWDAAPCDEVVAGVRFASLDIGSARVVGAYTLASSGGFSWRTWGACSFVAFGSTCAGAATSCAWMGPKWAACTGIACTGLLVAAGLGCAGAQLVM